MAKDNKAKRYYTNKDALRAFTKKISKLSHKPGDNAVQDGIIKDENKKPAGNARVKCIQFGYSIKVWTTDGSKKSAESHAGGINQVEKFITASARKWTKEAEENKA